MQYVLNELKYIMFIPYKISSANIANNIGDQYSKNEIHLIISEIHLFT